MYSGLSRSFYQVKLTLQLKQGLTEKEKKKKKFTTNNDEEADESPRRILNAASGLVATSVE